MAENNQPIKPEQSGDNKPSKFDELVSNLIKPLVEKLGPFGMPCVKAGEYLGLCISRTIDNIFDNEKSNN